MKEIPMLFNTVMVRASLEGRKTQTRRLTRETFVRENPIAQGYFENEAGALVKAPARVGDLIYVREKWTTFQNGYIYRADLHTDDGRLWPNPLPPNPDMVLWRPSLHMPKKAARIWLEVTGVRAEPLQHITVCDAAAEGCSRMREFPRVWDDCYGGTPYSWQRNPFVWVIDFRPVVHHGA